MQEELNGKFKEIEAYQFLTPKDQLGYAEEYISIKSDNPDEILFLNYSLSNSLEDIKIAIFKRTGLDIKLEKAIWKLNPYLSISVKYLMNKHQVTFSMTTFYEETSRIICVNMRVGDNWFHTSYCELNHKCYSYYYLEIFKKLKQIIENFESDESYD